jgi:hypothetical protein
MKRILLAVAALLLAAGAVTAAHAATAATVPPGVQVSGMTYQPGVHLPATHLPHVTLVNGALHSKNWSGYVDVACPTCALRYVAASFTLPSVNCARSPDGSHTSFWAGLDGFNDSTAEQTGADAFCSGGTANYFAWYEMFPLPPVAFSGVSPGDAISVTVYYNASTRHWQLGLIDLTNGGTLSAAVLCPSGSVCRNASAEVITEAPSLSSGAVLPLADFGQAGYEGIQVTSRSGTHGAMTSNGLWTTDSISMVNSTGNTLALPSPAYGGQAFQDFWIRAS